MFMTFHTNNWLQSAFRPNEVKDAKIKGLNDQLLEFCCDTKIEQVNLSKGEL